MRKIVLLAVALFGFTAAFAQSDVLTVAQQANDALGAKNYAKAVELLEKVIADGSASEDEAVLEQVNSAKKNLPIAYFRVGQSAASAAQKLTDAAAQSAKYNEAVAALDKAMETGSSYKVVAAVNNAKRMKGMVYAAQAAAPFNSGDFAKAADLFAKAYEADNTNNSAALNLAESYFKMDNYNEGVKVCTQIAALPAGQKNDAAIAQAKAKIAMYTNNKIAQLQQANDFDGIIAMAESLENKALAQKLTVQAYLLKKDYDKVIELGAAAAEAQADEADKSAVYFQLGTAYNAKENKAQAIEALKKVTAGASGEAAKAALAALAQ